MTTSETTPAPGADSTSAPDPTMDKQYPIKGVRFINGRTGHRTKRPDDERWHDLLYAACGDTGYLARGFSLGAVTPCTACREAIYGKPPTADTCRILTVRQPWGFAIAEGFKLVECRPRRTNYRGLLLIHAGQRHDGSVSIVRYSRAAARRLDELGGSLNFWNAPARVPSRLYPQPQTSLALSAVIATVQLVGCHQAEDDCCGPWGLPDMWHWELADVVQLKKAVPHKGGLGLRKPPVPLMDKVNETLALPDICTATMLHARYGRVKCGELAGHYDETRVPEGGVDATEPAGWHAFTLYGVPNVRPFIWSDRSHAATPHQPSTTEASRT